MHREEGELIRLLHWTPPADQAATGPARGGLQVETAHRAGRLRDLSF